MSLLVRVLRRRELSARYGMLSLSPRRRYLAGWSVCGCWICCRVMMKNNLSRLAPWSCLGVSLSVGRFGVVIQFHFGFLIVMSVERDAVGTGLFGAGVS
jgi:hypothetical protein